MMRKTLIVLGLAALHFAVSFALFMQTLAGTMGSFDAPRRASAGSRALEVLTSTLLFPIVQLAIRLPGGWLRGGLGYVPFVLNSLLWGLMLYLFFRLLSELRRAARR